MRIEQFNIYKHCFAANIVAVYGTIREQFTNNIGTAEIFVSTEKLKSSSKANVNILNSQRSLLPLDVNPARMNKFQAQPNTP